MIEAGRIAFQPGAPKIQQIVDALSSDILSGVLPSGAKLPTIRELVQELSVSKFTVVGALDRLRGRGLVESKQGSGYYVARRRPKIAETISFELLPQDYVSVLRRSLLSDRDSIRPGCGFLPESWLPGDMFRQTIRSTARASVLRMSEYGQAGGYLPLKKHLQGKLAAFGLSVHIDQIVTTASTMQAIDLLLRHLVRPGDVVLLDNPCYFNFHAIVELHGARAIAINRDLEGPDFTAMEAALNSYKPRVYLTSGLLHNPTGQTLTSGTAFRLLQLALKHQLHIIEDDLYGDLHVNPPPRLAALAGLDFVTYVSGFSKTLTANSRVSFVAASPKLAAAMAQLKLSVGCLTSEVLEQIMYRMLSEGSYAKHLSRIKPRLADSMERVTDWLQQVGCTFPYGTGFGMFVWAKLPDGVNGESLSIKALANDMVLAPGTLFSRDPKACCFMRFNVAHCDGEHVRERIASLFHSTLAFHEPRGS